MFPAAFSKWRISHINQREFTLDDQLAFAKLSGDYNPLHVDVILARRLLFGSPVVHGIHSLLWSLDCWLKSCPGMVEIHSLKAIFPKPLKVGEKVTLSLKNESNNHVKIELLSGESTLISMEIEWKKKGESDFDSFKKSFPKKNKPRDLSEDEIDNRSGNLDLYLNIEAAAGMFPHLTEYLSPVQISTMLGTTRLVGTECPGLHSIYSELHPLSIGDNKCTTLKYEVKKYNRLLGLISMNLVTPDMTGKVMAFVRPKPIEQNNYLKLKDEVGSKTFIGQRALVIGGSRGLGEVTAKLLAAGSADVKLTYHQGKEDAECIVKEINFNGGSAGCFQFDVLRPERNSLMESLNNWRPTHLYYFATPFIISGMKGSFSTDLFKKFCDYYVSGFSNIIETLSNLGLKNAFYPSTVYIDELSLNMGEYAVAKLAGEMLCMFFEKNYNDFIIYRPRLPRMKTDQTVSLVKIDSQNPVPVMLEHIRLFNDFVL